MDSVRKRKDRFSRACLNNECRSCGSMLSKMMLMNENMKGFQDQFNRYDAMVNRLRVKESFRAMEGDGGSDCCGGGYSDSTSNGHGGLGMGMGMGLGMGPDDGEYEPTAPSSFFNAMMRSDEGGFDEFGDTTCSGCAPRRRRRPMEACNNERPRSCCDEYSSGNGRGGGAYDDLRGGSFNGYHNGGNNGSGNGELRGSFNGCHNGGNMGNGNGHGNGRTRASCCLEQSEGGCGFRDSGSNGIGGMGMMNSYEGGGVGVGGGGYPDDPDTSMSRLRILESLTDDKRESGCDSGVDRTRVLDSFSEPEIGGSPLSSNDWTDSRSKIRDCFKEEKCGLGSSSNGRRRFDEGCCWNQSY